MFRTNKKLVLASQSPRRKAFFSELGLQFTVCPADLDERRQPGEKPGVFVRRMAHEKAMLAGRKNPSAWTVSADTIVTIDQDVLGKPGSPEEAVMMLMRLSGKEHEVRTGYCLSCVNDGITVVESVITRVRFASFGQDIAGAYVRTGEPLDKAGAYGIQGKGGILVAEIEGSYSNVVGLPLTEVVALLQRYGVITAR